MNPIKIIKNKYMHSDRSLIPTGEILDYFLPDGRSEFKCKCIHCDIFVWMDKDEMEYHWVWCRKR